MSTATITKTCPDWCVAPHDEDTTFHIQADQTVTDIYGTNVKISAYRHDQTGESGICVGSHEFLLAQLPALKAAIARAEQAAQSAAA